MSGGIDPYQQQEFRCNHCNGRIVIPIDLPPTTGPCPHCGGIITSPSFMPPPPPQMAAPAPMPAAPAPEPVPVSVPAQQVQAPVPVPVAPPAPVSTPAPVAAAVASAPAYNPPPTDQVPAAATVPAEPVAAPRKPIAPAPKSARNGLLPALMVMLFLILAAGGGAIYFLKNSSPKISPPTGISGRQDGSGLGPTGKMTEEEYLRTGWQREAYAVLRGYTEATTPEEKAAYVLGGKAAATRLADFYGNAHIDDSDTPASGFAVYDLPMDDRKRGLFLMAYDQPPQMELKEYFRPLATLEVQYGLENANLLLASVAQPSNFAMEPVRVHAFFKRTKDGLKLDWDTFIQSKYRTLRNFLEIPTPGKRAIFRVTITEDVPEEGKAVAGVRTYRIEDPANSPDDTTRINVKVDSEAGRALSPINWRGSKDARPATRTATIELEWVGADNPQLSIHQFICWEFLGLGGETPAR